MTPALLPRRLMIAVVRFYRLFLSPWLGSACRFEPTCSAYALAALHMHGARTGGRLTVWRLLRCHPWCQGGHDPVPLAPRLFSDLLRGSTEERGAQDGSSSARSDLRKTSQ
ncbi:MAG: rane protein insertion efficiency factor YidD [Pseudomonadota bacterium]|jgi:putative membrane protein insertion efficiency factor